MVKVEGTIQYYSIHGYAKCQSLNTYYDISECHKEIMAWYRHCTPKEQQSFHWYIIVYDDYNQVKEYNGNYIELSSMEHINKISVR